MGITPRSRGSQGARQVARMDCPIPTTEEQWRRSDTPQRCCQADGPTVRLCGGSYGASEPLNEWANHLERLAKLKKEAAGRK